MGIVEGIKAVSEPATKLIEYVSKAIGKAYEPRHVKKMADAHAYEIRAIGEAIRDNVDLPIVFKDKQTSVDISEYEELIKRAGNRIAYQEIKKQENIENIVDKAYSELEGKNSQTCGDVSPDWMNRFMDYAGEVSLEEMQNVWARLLSGEVLSPNSFSLRTLECLRNMNSTDAKLFEKVSSFVHNGEYIYFDDETNKKHGLYFSEILCLDDCGLVNSGSMVARSKEIGSSPVLLFDFGSHIIIASARRQVKITYMEYPLSRAGMELLRIVNRAKVPEAYLIGIIQDLSSSNKEVSFELHQVIERVDGGIHYDLSVVQPI